jgi:hypothetical protein
VRERLFFQISDDLLDDGVVAVFGLDELKLLSAVGEDREVSPVRPQLGPRTDQAGAPDDQPPPTVDGFGDLRLALVGVVDAMPGVLVDLLDGAADGVGNRYERR